MKTLLFIALFFAFSFQTQAQNQDIPAYLLTLKGDTLRGTAYSYSEHESAEKFVFRSNGTDKYQTYSPEEILAYGILDDQKAVYVVKNIPVFQKNQKFFCRQVWRSCTNLYMVEKMHVETSYSQAGELRYKKEYKDVFVLEREGSLLRLQEKSFQAALQSYFEGCPRIASKTHDLSLKYLKKTLIDYDSCKNCLGGKDLMPTKKQKWGLYYGVKLGFNVSKPYEMITPKLNYLAPSFSFEYGLGYNLGAIIGTSIGSTFAIQAELMFAVRNSHFINERYGLSGDLKGRFLQINVLAKYFPIRNKFKPCLMAGFSLYNRNFGTYKVVIPDYSVYNVKNFVTIDFREDQAGINLIFGAGMTLFKVQNNSLDLEMRYNGQIGKAYATDVVQHNVEFLAAYCFGK